MKFNKFKNHLILLAYKIAFVLRKNHFSLWRLFIVLTILLTTILLVMGLVLQFYFKKNVSNLPDWVGALATFSAVLVSLYLANQPDRPNIECELFAIFKLEASKNEDMHHDMRSYYFQVSGYNFGKAGDAIKLIRLYDAGQLLGITSGNIEIKPSSAFEGSTIETIPTVALVNLVNKIQIDENSEYVGALNTNVTAKIEFFSGLKIEMYRVNLRKEFVWD